ncbi:MAG TPA: cytochrome C oxidase subunit IV family protein [Vicinamibacterales bacterium]|nr:cytochrome C oxidase subunit IV family protein [Vicinamibacterales bacterium]
MSDHASHSSGAGHVSPISLYITIFAALMVLTAVTVGAAFVDLGQFNFSVAMLIAGFKASLVVWYFMHVKYQSHLTKLTLATGMFFLAILLGMMLIDYTSKDFTAMPKGTDPTSEMGAPAAH